MADKRPARAEVQDQVVVAKPDPPRYPKERLIQNAREVFGVAPEVVVGALHGKPGNEFAKEEVGRYVEAFLRRRPE